MVDLSDTQFCVCDMQSLRLKVTRSLVYGKPGIQCIPHYLNIENDVINSTFELTFFLNIEEMKDLSVHEIVCKTLLM